VRRFDKIHAQSRRQQRRALSTGIGGKKGVEAIRSVNMHQLGVNFVERVLDVRRRHTDDGQAAAPGESLKFLAQNRGWQSEERKKRKAQLLQLNDVGLRVALGHAVGADVFLIPKAYFAKETPEQGDEGWWYQHGTINHKLQGVSTM
jgi:hypothetical protein